MSIHKIGSDLVRPPGPEGPSRASASSNGDGVEEGRNVPRADRVEIDLIAQRGTLLIFVEVKSRRGGEHGLAAEAVDDRKQRRLRRGAHAWLNANPLEARRSHQRRFDVVTCLYQDAFEAENRTTAPEMARWSIEHWEAAF